MKKRICGKGWVLHPSPTDGKYVPFFIKTRDKDIIWSENSLPEILRNKSEEGTDVILNYPMYQWKFNKDGWSVTLNQDGSYEATKKIAILQNSTYVSSSQINITDSLPFTICNDNDLYINVSIYADNNDIICSSIVVLPQDDKLLDEVKFALINNLTVFPDTFSQSTEYENQYIFAKVSGNLNIEI